MPETVPAAPYGPGARVLLRGDRWTITGRTRHIDCESLRLDGCGRANTGMVRTVLLPFDIPHDINRRRRVVIVSVSAWLERVRCHLLVADPPGSLVAARRASIAVMPHQLVPALAMLREGRLRILLADEVGLGKTIQAGLVIAELTRADPSTRAIVVAPAALREQWRGELQDRFALDATIADSDWLSERARTLPADVNPWSLAGIYVTSMDLVKRPEVLRSLEDVLWDLMVVDEAHQATPGTARLAAVDAIGGRARRVLLLTATPPYGDAGHLHALESIGRQGPQDEITTLRRTREDAGRTQGRKSILLPVRLSAAERRMQRLLGSYAAEVWKSAADDRPHARRLAATLLKKRALSSPRSLAVTVRRRIHLLERRAPPANEQMWLPWGDEDPLADDVPDAVLATRGLSDPDRERALLERIADAAELAAANESKVRLLARFVRRAREPLLVFTEYRDTLSSLAVALAAHQPLQLHGGLSLAERSAVIREFQRSGKLLLATDAASEGLNLHYRCRTVIHFEVPWTPMRLEQRTGRVDRFGQQHRVHELLLVANHSSERLVLAPLVRRLRTARAHERTRWQALDESTVAAAILGSLPLAPSGSLASCPPAAPILERAADVEAARLILWRRFARGTRVFHDPASRIPVSYSRGGPDPAHLCVRVTYEAADGRSLASALLLLAVSVEWRLKPGSNAEFRRAARELVTGHSASIATHVREHLAAQGAAPHALVRPMQCLARRESAMSSAHASAARMLVQAGLFDARATAQAAARARAATALAEESNARAAFTAVDSSIETRIEVVAIHFGPIGVR